jgi:hypothetical protein
MPCEEAKAIEAEAKKRLLEVETDYLTVVGPRLGRTTTATPAEVEEMRKAGDLYAGAMREWVAAAEIMLAAVQRHWAQVASH